MFGDAEVKAVNKELCEGNPVILKVPSMSEPNNPQKKHFVIAKAMSVSVSGEPTFIVNNPGLIDPNNSIQTLSTIRGYRLYRQAADPSMLFAHLTGGAEMVITDPQGRRSGYNPLTKETFNEIPGAAYTKAEAISSPDEAGISTPLEAKFEGLEPLDGT